MQATTLTGSVLKHELNHVKREKSKEQPLFCNCLFFTDPKLNAEA